MKTYKPLLVLATAALTGCMNIGSFNTKDSGQKPPSAGHTPVTSTQPTPAPKAAATPVVKKVAPKPTAATPAPTPAPAVASKPSPAPAATPKPTPSSQVIKEETTSKVEVISSRPVVGTDAQMGN